MQYIINIQILGKNAKNRWVVTAQKHILIKGKMGTLVKLP